MNSGKNKFLNHFIEIFNLKSLEPTCFKSQNPTMIDLMLTNHSSIFIKTKMLETTKGPPKTICYRDLNRALIKKRSVVT